MNRTLPCLLKASHRQACSTPDPLPEHQPTDDIVNPRVREMIATHPNLSKITSPDLAQKQEELRSHRLFLKQFDERKWLTKKGKKYLIDFDNNERKEMKLYFNSLDKKGCGSIGIDQLQELLLSVGLAETREEIKTLVDAVDKDQSGKIQFGQFLSMILNEEGQNEEIVQFFKMVIGGELKKEKKLAKPYKRFSRTPQAGFSEVLAHHPYPKGLSFDMIVSHIRRKHMMTALNIKRKEVNESNHDTSVERIAKGQRVMQALQRMYERKLIMQIKESKRVNNLAKTDKTGLMRNTASQPWLLSKKTH